MQQDLKLYLILFYFINGLSIMLCLRSPLLLLSKSLAKARPCLKPGGTTLNKAEELEEEVECSYHRCETSSIWNSKVGFSSKRLNIFAICCKLLRLLLFLTKRELPGPFPKPPHRTIILYPSLDILSFVYNTRVSKELVCCSMGPLQGKRIFCIFISVFGKA